MQNDGFDTPLKITSAGDLPQLRYWEKTLAKIAVGITKGQLELRLHDGVGQEVPGLAALAVVDDDLLRIVGGLAADLAEEGVCGFRLSDELYGRQ